MPLKDYPLAVDGTSLLIIMNYKVLTLLHAGLEPTTSPLRRLSQLEFLAKNYTAYQSPGNWFVIVQKPPLWSWMKDLIGGKQLALLEQIGQLSHHLAGAVESSRMLSSHSALWHTVSGAAIQREDCC